jgi:hypothetical protein
VVNAAVAGSPPWVRLNDHLPNQIYDPEDPPKMLPEDQDKDLFLLVRKYAEEMLLLSLP